MILDRVDYGNLASAFRLRGYSKCSNSPIIVQHKGPDLISKERGYSKCSNSPIIVQHKGPDLISKERAMIERAKERRQRDVEQAKLKLAKKEARTRIREFENQRKRSEFEMPTPNKASETSDVDSGIFMIDPPQEDVSRAELVSKIVSKWRAKARWTKVIRHVRSMSSSNSNATASKVSSPKQNELLLSPIITPTRTRASSTGSIRAC